MKDIEKIIEDLQTRIDALKHFDISKYERADVHILSERVMNLSGKLNQIAYMMLYTLDNKKPSDKENP